ncbi:MAG TPA: hypothetical protein VFM58_19465 [Solirubrobacteraceae bacterium]|nr:hypothetical protein [Solirubrobacteraceae bacterium]
MSRLHLAALAATLSCALMLGVTATAGAQTQELAKRVPITGKAKNGKKFKGTFTIDRFARRNGALYAVGKLKGRLKHRHVTRRGVRIPVTLPAAQAAQIPPTPGACQILNLTLQPLDLNLLGLRVRTSRIDLRVEGVPGSGQLLGNLLCGVLGLLDPDALSSTPLGQLAQILNSLLALSPRTA